MNNAAIGRGVCCMATCITTIFICYFNLAVCVVISIVASRQHWVGYVFLAVSCLWNVICLLRNCCCRKLDQDRLKYNCWASCTSVVVLLAASFTLITRYHYYELLPKNPTERYSVLSFHKMGIFGLVSGIPVMYGCQFKHLMQDKKMIYRVIVDFIDIYEMAELLSKGAPSCTPISSNSGNTYPRVKSNQFNCIESKNSALREKGWLEVTLQIWCSFAFLIFFVIYREAMKEEDKRDSGRLKKITRITRLLQDIPFSAMRALAWFMYGFDTDQFIFLVKNAIAVSLMSLEFFRTCGESSDESDRDNQTPGDGEEQIDAEDLQIDAGEQGNKRHTRNRKQNRNQMQQRYAMQQIQVPVTAMQQGYAGQPVNTMQQIQVPVIAMQQGYAGQPVNTVQQIQVPVMQQGYAMQPMRPGQQIVVSQINPGFDGATTSQSNLARSQQIESSPQPSNQSFLNKLFGTNKRY